MKAIYQAMKSQRSATIYKPKESGYIIRFDQRYSKSFFINVNTMKQAWEEVKRYGYNKADFQVIAD